MTEHSQKTGSVGSTTLRPDQQSQLIQQTISQAPAPPWWNSALASAPAVVVAVAGFWIVHHLSKRRQARDETFKLAQSARDQVAEAAVAASNVWTMKASKARQAAIHDVYRKFGRLGRHLEMLRSRNAAFDVQTRMLELRKAATTDIEVAAPTDADRRSRIDLAADLLEEAIDRAFRKVHG